MEPSKFYACTNYLTIQQYTKLLHLIQSEHAFGNREGGNIKYVSTTIETHIDTRDGIVFGFVIELDGMGSVAFIKYDEDSEPDNNTIVTGKPIFESIVEYLSLRGAWETTKLSNRKIRALAGMRNYIGQQNLSTLSNAEKVAHAAAAVSMRIVGFSEEAASNCTLYVPTSETVPTGRLIFSENDNEAIVQTTDGKTLFVGQLPTLEDLLRVLDLTGIECSF